jgi:hypothetical protein
MVNPYNPHACPLDQDELSEISLCCLLRVGKSCERIIADDVIAAVVGTEMMLYRLIGMRYGCCGERRIVEFFRGTEEKFHVHHIIDDHSELPVTVILVCIPGSSCADNGMETGHQRAGSIQECRTIGRITGDPVRIAETAVDHEADIVIVRGELLVLHPLRELFRKLPSQNRSSNIRRDTRECRGRIRLSTIWMCR